MTTKQYISALNQLYKLGNATEHTYRGDLRNLIESLVPDVIVTNEPKRQECGAPDYIITKKDIPIGFIEAKNIGDSDLDGRKRTGNKEQFDRYKSSLNNLIFTDYLSFHIYQDGEFKTKISIGEITNNSINPLNENFASFENLIKDFCSHIGQTIKSSKKLAEMMAGKARLLSDVIGKSLTSDEINHSNSTLKDQLQAFKNILIHDISPEGFADVYAQTITYGMFTARLHDPSLPTFSRQEASELIPKSNPFLRKLFGYIAGPDIDDRIKWIVDSLADIFLHCNVENILKSYGKTTKTEDPIIHFYETFLSEYDPKLRKAKGVWYTPQPVVQFIVRAVDDILKNEFALKEGLADINKTKIKVEEFGKKVDKEVHKVQILDPATGTGTFLIEVVKQIYKKFKGQQGIWGDYVENHLLPRLNGFEILMASYAMAHLKMDLLLRETGYNYSSALDSGSQRLRVYLTNSLEESHPDTGTLFASWLSDEANEANHIKRDSPVMVILGNPPYSGESANKGDWIMSLMEDYKKEPGGKEKLKERNPKWINDDYVKFIRYGQYFIEKNGSGVLAFINPHGYLDNPTFRGMRWNLLKTYDKIYTIDLHGNSKKKETAPDGGGLDQNVFDIMQGVSINLFVKTGKKKANELGKVYHHDLYGKREIKYDYLLKNTLNSVPYQELPNQAPDYFFVKKDLTLKKEYENGIKVNELFPVNSVGIVTSRDGFVVDMDKDDLETRIKDFFVLPKSELQNKYNLKENSNWKIDEVKQKVKDFDTSYINPISYRPFDCRFVYYNDNFIERSRHEVMQHFLKGENLGLTVCKQFKSGHNYQHIFVSNKITESSYVSNRTSEITNVFPLYLYPETNGQEKIDSTSPTAGTLGRIPNLNMEIINKIAKTLNLHFQPEKNSPPLKEEYPKGEVVAEYNKISNLPHLKTFRKELRNNLTPAEATLWKLLKGKQLGGRKFRRQHSVGNYILDFYCPSERIAIELDGQGHFEYSQAEYDKERDLFLEYFGIRVLRFENNWVWANPDALLERVKSYFGSVKQDYEPLSPADSSPWKGEQFQGKVFCAVDMLDYIYAVLHSPTFREKYKEFLKIDFPRVTYPKDTTAFWELVRLGKQVRELHLLESPLVKEYITQYPMGGDNLVGKLDYRDGNVYINETQYFADVPQIAWEFYIGGYQPAQKWLKDRKGSKLDYEAILHYQKIIVALTETDRITKEIDNVLLR